MLAHVSPEIPYCIKERNKQKMTENISTHKELRNKVTNLIEISKIRCSNYLEAV